MLAGLAAGLLLVAALVFGLLRALPAGDAHPGAASGPWTTAARWDLAARLALLRVELARFGEPPLRLARVVERRLGPVEWNVARAGAWVRVVTATGHFPAEVYGRPYTQQLQAFEKCLDESQRAPGDERFVSEWQCGQRKPPPEEEFARFELRWRCVAISCRWLSLDPAAWQRIAAAPCRTSATPECWPEVAAYLASGRLASEP